MLDTDGPFFLACMEATTISDDWKRAIVQADSQDTVKVAFAESVFPPVNRLGGYATEPRVLRTPFVEQWNQHPEEAQRQAKRLSEELLSAIQQGRAHELAPFTGETVGLIHEILPADDIVRRIVVEAQEVLKAATTHFRQGSNALDNFMKLNGYPNRTEYGRKYFWKWLVELIQIEM